MDREDNRPRSLAEADAAQRMEVAQDMAANPTRAPQPWNESRADGWPVADAIFVFVHETVRRQVSFHLAFRAAGINDATSTATLTASSWECLRHLLSLGKLTATGFAHGETEVRQLLPALFDQAVFDPLTREIEAASVRYSGVRIFANPYSPTTDLPASIPVSETEHAPNTTSTIRGFHQQDAPLVKEMHRRIGNGEFPNAFQAASAMASRAEGGGTFESKRARLRERYRRSFSTVQN